MIKDLPKVSVITVCFNAEEFIEDTIQSVLDQDYPRLEYVIVDGASTDRTMQIVRKYEDKISLIVSEPDEGLFDAMNKGAVLATGDWLNYMNAGDTFYDKSVLSNIFQKSDLSSYDFIYGGSLKIDESDQIVTEPKDLSILNQGMRNAGVCHQATFVRRKLMQKYPFNTESRFSSDFEFIYRIYKEGYRFYRYDGIIANYLKGGFSSGNLLKSKKRDYEIVKKFNSSLKVRSFYFKEFLRIRTLLASEKYLGKKVTKDLKRMRSESRFTS